MNGTVKQFKDTLELMRSVYNFDDDKTRLNTRSFESCDSNHLTIITTDEKTGVKVQMSKSVLDELEEG